MGKRSADDAGSSAAAPHKAKRSRTGIRAALPTSDDAWRRKLERAKESNVIRAKTLQTYAKVKARALAAEDAKAASKNVAGEDEAAAAVAATAPMHPERQARIDDAEEAGGSGRDDKPAERRRPQRGPGARPAKRPQSFFQKAQEEAAQKKAEAEARRAEFERRAAEREEARARRARHQKAMAKARRVDTHRGSRHGGGGGDNQRRKLGRESGVLLDRVRKMMGK
ncbi:hypothetical protein SPBR_01004 [Sporothrix brasiliensis 5110]|uniref:rRNA-processing protein FYV7 n=1 Tax=Sporothrix brasiliensis 5110 TaxID=1398154 RepID=A0A0C2IZ25_9PEZI|nr:uncharacterized protein SPBR_01004 [Sporothrix brasiliensis 5110]KIH90197.1 hypothetical protein SPBR_01004 [Sporothrix brasiliensis 5110]